MRFYLSQNGQQIAAGEWSSLAEALLSSRGIDLRKQVDVQEESDDGQIFFARNEDGSINYQKYTVKPVTIKESYVVDPGLYLR